MTDYNYENLSRAIVEDLIDVAVVGASAALLVHIAGLYQTKLEDASVDVGTATGLQLGTASTQKIGFLGAVPRVAHPSTTDLATVLESFGFRAAGTNFSLTCGGGLNATGTLSAFANFRTTTLTVNSGSSTPLATSSRSVVFADATTGNRGIVLPAQVTDGNRTLIKKVDASANTVTVSVASSGTIEGAATIVLTTQYQYVEVISTTTSGVYYRVG